MSESLRLIEVEEATAAIIERRAEALGLSVAEFVSGLVSGDESDIVPVEDIAELDRRRTAVLSGASKTVPHDEVVRWLETWGTPEFVPWRQR